MSTEKPNNEKLVKKFVSEKRLYTFSLREKDGDKDNLLLVINEKIKNDSNNEFSANKVRIYNESLDKFFELIDEIKKEVEKIRNENRKN